MRTVEEIKTAINQLSLEERAEIAAELCGWEDDDWDRQMKSAATADKFRLLNREADAAQNDGQTVPLDDILREPCEVGLALKSTNDLEISSGGTV
jgi:hypothetical protein